MNGGSAVGMRGILFYRKGSRMQSRGIEYLASLTHSFQEKKIAVVGDLMLDAYTWGKVNRISPEAPVPIVQVTRRSRCLGGAANVMRNIVSLGASAAAFGVIGEDGNGEILRGLLEKTGIDYSGVIVDRDRPTTFKERIIAGSQQLLRLDDELQTQVESRIREQLLDRFEKYLKKNRPDAVILEDYAKGLFSRDSAQRIIDLCNRNGIMVSLDPNPRNPMRLQGLTLMKPNRAEAYSLAAVPPPLGDWTMEGLQEVAQAIRRDWHVKYLLVSLAEHGMALFLEDGGCKVIPTRAREVFDVSGAGDTVIAASTLALCVKDDPVSSAEIANYAAGIVVGKLGTATVTVEELLEYMKL